MKGKLYLGVCLLWITCIVSTAEAMVIITELHADPAAGLAGDANADGVRSSSADEFIELFNAGDTSVDLSGWSISDSTSTRHIFASNSLLDPLGHLVIFGGGQPNLPGVFWQTSSTGALSLNNGGDTIGLLNAEGVLVNEVVYDDLASNDQSIVRAGDPTAEFVLHSSVSDQFYSPGRALNGLESSAAAVPEPATLISLLTGIGMLTARRRFLE